MQKGDSVQQRPNERGFSLHNIESPAFPILLSVPHAGRDYPPQILEKLRVPSEELIRLEDRHADRLVQKSIAQGMTAIIAHRARAWIDLNRAENDVDNDMVLGCDKANTYAPSAKTRGGLGLIPRRLSGCGELWGSAHDPKDIASRISSYHAPYHHAIDACLSAMQARFGIAILLDIHSMPPLSRQHGWNPAKIVIGDRFGKSASSRYSETIMVIAKERKVDAALNHPYPGDHILTRHGKPHKNIHAIQVEIDRTLYLDELLREPSHGLSSMVSFINDIALALLDQCNWGQLAAAE